MTTLHLAGTPVNVEGRWIQRCLICGEKLIDSNDQANIEVMLEGNEASIHFFPVGGIIKIRPYSQVCIEITEVPHFDNAPKGLCIDLVEETCQD